MHRWGKNLFLSFLREKRGQIGKNSKKRLLRASTRAHDPFCNNKKIWPTLIFPRFAPPDTFPMLPVRALINDPPKKVMGINYDPWPFFWQHKIWPNFNICMTQFFPQLPACALINDLEKKRVRAATRAYDLFLDNTKFDLILLIWDTELPTHLQSFLCVP